MPLEQVRRRSAIDKAEFHRRLRAWLRTGEERSGPLGFNRKIWVYVRSGGEYWGLDIDTKRPAIAEYLALVDRHGDDVSWTRTRSQTGKQTAVSYGPENVRITSFYLYWRSRDVGRDWKGAMRQALRRYVSSHGSQLISRQAFLDAEIATIAAATRTTGKTPRQTVSRELQELRDLGELTFVRRGQYLVTLQAIEAEREDLPDAAIDAAILAGKFEFNDVDTDESLGTSRRRKGQSRLRKLCLGNYGGRCALCGAADPDLLRASHIVRWSDDKKLRGRLANVICMCALHDALFEAGAFVLTGDGGVRVTPLGKSLTGAPATVLSQTHHFSPPTAHPPAEEFLRRHRHRVSRGAPA